MKNGTTKIQPSMERTDTPVVHILSSPTIKSHRRSIDKSSLPGQIYSPRMVLHNCIFYLVSIRLGKRARNSSSSHISNNRLLQASEINLVEICYYRNICINNSVISNNLESPGASSSFSIRGRIFNKSDNRSVLQLSHSRILRRLHVGDNSSNIDIQCLLVAIPLDLEGGCSSNHGIILGSDDDSDTYQFDRLWSIDSRICDSSQISLSRQHNSLPGSSGIHVYSGNDLRNYRSVLSNSPSSSQCNIQSGIRSGIFNRRSFDQCDNAFYEIQKTEVAI